MAQQCSPLNDILKTLDMYYNTPYENGSYINPMKYNFHKNAKQSHGGDLLTHSKWCALQILQWFEEKNEIIPCYLYQYKDTLFLACLLHDIAKAGFCGYRCVNGVCWYDSYSEFNYDGVNDGIVNEIYGGDIIMGYRCFYIENPCLESICEFNEKLMEKYGSDNGIKYHEKHVCFKRWTEEWHRVNNSKTADFAKVCEYMNVDRKIVAFLVYTHIDFEKYVTGNEDIKNINDFFGNYEQSLKKTGLCSSKELFLMSILISMADMSSESFPRIGLSDKAICDYSWCDWKYCILMDVRKGMNPIYNVYDEFNPNIGRIMYCYRQLCMEYEIRYKESIVENDI